MPLGASRRAVVAGAGAALGAASVGVAPAAHAADYYARQLAGDRAAAGGRAPPGVAVLLRGDAGAGSAGAGLPVARGRGSTARWPRRTTDRPTTWPTGGRTCTCGPTAVWELQTSGTRGGYRVMYDYGRRLLVRRLVSPRPVLEVMTEFWENYLNVPVNGDSQFTWRARYGDVIR